MSNQVFSNSQHKFYAGKAPNFYNVLNDIVIAPNVLNTIIFNAPPHVNEPGFRNSIQDPKNAFEIDGSNGNIICLSEGMYSVTMKFVWSNQTTPNNPCKLSAFMTLTTNNFNMVDIIMDGFTQRFDPAGGDVVWFGSFTHILFLEKNDHINIKVQSLMNLAENVVLTNGGTELIAQRIY